jgi:signal transduction histidine kinase
MQQMEQAAECKATGLEATGLAETGLAEADLLAAASARTKIVETERKRVETVVETLTDLRGKGENLAEVVHDARNMVTALGLYCDLLEEPGVLNASYLHYAGELRLVATASRRLVEKMMALSARPAGSNPCGASGLCAANPGATGQQRIRQKDPLPGAPIDDLVSELLASRNLLAALAGPAIVLTVDADGSALPVRMTSEDLTRILVNLVKNAVEAMPDGGRIMLGLHEFHTEAEAAPWLVLTVEDTGPGIPPKALDKIFVSGYTTGAIRPGGSSWSSWPVSHHGLGLSITRSIVESAGGRIRTVNRAPNGACFVIELPVRAR